MLYNNSELYQKLFQNSGSAFHKEIVYLHDEIFYYLIVIRVTVTWLMGMIYIRYNGSEKTLRLNQFYFKEMDHGTLIEIVWTLTPALIVILIGIPSFKVLYNLDEIMNPNITVKCVEAQWSWIYGIFDFNHVTFLCQH